MPDRGKTEENRLRLMAQRRGFRLVKSQKREALAPEQGEFMIVDAVRNQVVAGRIDTKDALTLVQIEAWLTALPPPAEDSGGGEGGGRRRAHSSARRRDG